MSAVFIIFISIAGSITGRNLPGSNMGNEAFAERILQKMEVKNDIVVPEEVAENPIVSLYGYQATLDHIDECISRLDQASISMGQLSQTQVEEVVLAAMTCSEQVLMSVYG